MKAMIALMRQEIVERRLLAATGVLLGLLPLGMPFLPHVSHQPAAELRGVAALVLAGLLSGGLALILGATVVGRDLGERRLGFFFARPLAGWTIWGGKMTAALLIAWGAGLLVLLPAVLLGDLVEAELWGQIGIGAAAVLVVVPLAHAVGVLLRARSAWLLLDLIGLAAFGALAYSALTALGRAGAMTAFKAAAWGLGAVAFAVLVAAGLVQVARGRTDLARGHRALSLALWGGLLAAALLLQVAARWVIAAPLSSLQGIEHAAAAPAGPWIAVSGPAAQRGDYRPAFLLDLEGGSTRRLPLLTFSGGWWIQPEYSADGRRAVWVERGSAGHQARVADLRDGEIAVRRTIPLGDHWESFQLSPKGDLLAVLSAYRLVIEDAVSGRLLASAPFQLRGERTALRFLSPARVRVAAVRPNGVGLQVAVDDLEIAGSRVVPVWQSPGLEIAPINLAFSPDGARLQMRQGRTLRLWDIATGKELAAVPSAGFGPGAFLPDGRWVVISGGKFGLFSQRGEPLQEVPLPGASSLGALVAPDLFSVVRSSTGPAGQVYESLLLDLRTGGVRVLGTGLVPAAGPDALPGSFGARTFLRGRELLLLDPATGKLQPVPLDGA
jgi:hypothetical protein